MYTVVKDFIDLQDNNYFYHAGDNFPRDGVKASKDRIRELITGKNKCGVALIDGEMPEEKPKPKKAKKEK